MDRNMHESSCFLDRVCRKTRSRNILVGNFARFLIRSSKSRLECTHVRTKDRIFCRKYTKMDTKIASRNEKIQSLSSYATMRIKNSKNFFQIINNYVYFSSKFSLIYFRSKLIRYRINIIYYILYYISIE